MTARKRYVGPFFSWSRGTRPTAWEDVSSDYRWARFAELYSRRALDDRRRDVFGEIDLRSSAGSVALDRLIAIWRENGAKALLIEQRYIDSDFRSMHADFFGGKFQRVPNVAHRVHAFTKKHDLAIADPVEVQDSYLGYAILRPLPNNPVGRSMVKPPGSMTLDPLVTVTETVHLFGIDLRIDSVPFISQDGEYSRCAHAAAWMLAYFFFLSGESGRFLMSDLHTTSRSTSSSFVRQLPSEGMSTSSLFGLLEQSLASPVLRAIDHNLPPNDVIGLEETVRRYIDSNLPILGYSEDHVWLVVGYSEAQNGRPQTIVVHDDQEGPFVRSTSDEWHSVDDFESPTGRSPWEGIVIPLPKKAYLTGETALGFGELAFERLGLSEASGNHFRAYLMSGVAYKSRSRTRLAEPLRRAYLRLDLPRYIWVVEALDADSRVCGEALFDSTAHHIEVSPSDFSAALLAINTLDAIYWVVPDHDFLEIVQGSTRLDPYESAIHRKAGAIRSDQT